jgi:hypothetical protein
MKMFSVDFVSTLHDIIIAHCSDGSCLTSSALTKQAGLEESDKIHVSRAVKEQLSEEVGVQAGPQGGFRLLSVEPKRTPTAVKAPFIASEEFCADVRNELTAALKRAKGISSGYVSGRLMEKYPECFGNTSLVTAAVHTMPEFTVSKGRGIHWAEGHNPPQ